MKMPLLIAAAFIVSILFMGCPAGKNADGYTFKFNMQKGSKFDYAMNMDMSMKQSVMGKEMTMKSKMTMGYLFEVTNDSAGWKTVAATISKIAMDMNAGDMSMKFDTDNPSADTTGPMAMAGKIFGGMKDGKFTFTIDENGTIGEVHGFNEILQKSITAANIPNADMVIQSMGKSFDENQFKQNMQQSFNIYPGKPVKPGESWTKNTTLNNSGMLMKMDNTYTLESVNGDDAVIKIASKITSGMDSSSMTGMKVNMDGSMSGNMNYDISNGLPKKGDMDMKMSMRVTGHDMDMPIDMDMKMTFTSSKK